MCIRDRVHAAQQRRLPRARRPDQRHDLAFVHAQIEAARTFNFTPYVVAGLLFVLLAIPTGRIADAAAARATRRQEGA